MRSTKQQTAARVLVGLTFLWVCSSCATFEKLFKPKTEKSQAQVATAPSSAARSGKSAPFVHSVRWHGESLSLIAKWYTGSYKNWRALADTNPRINPNHIKIGDRIIIPKKLLKTKKSMPRNFVTSAPVKKKSYPAEQKEPISDTVGLELFEPKD